jgi:hypothetical protein
MGIHKVKAFVCEEVYQSTPPVDLLPGERHPFGTVTTLSSLDNLEQVLSRGFVYCFTAKLVIYWTYLPCKSEGAINILLNHGRERSLQSLRSGYDRHPHHGDVALDGLRERPAFSGGTR